MSDFIDGEMGEWRIERLTQYLWPCDVSNVLKVPNSPPGVADCNY